MSKRSWSAALPFESICIYKSRWLVGLINCAEVSRFHICISGADVPKNKLKATSDFLYQLLWSSTCYFAAWNKAYWLIFYFFLLLPFFPLEEKLPSGKKEGGLWYASSGWHKMQHTVKAPGNWCILVNRSFISTPITGLLTLKMKKNLKSELIETSIFFQSSFIDLSSRWTSKNVSFTTVCPQWTELWLWRGGGLLTQIVAIGNWGHLKLFNWLQELFVTATAETIIDCVGQ